MYNAMGKIMMELLIELIQTDLLSGTTNCLAKGIAHLQDHTLSYLEENKEPVRHEVFFEEGHVVLRRFADTYSETDLRLNQTSMAQVKSPYGVMFLETYLEQYLFTEEEWSVQYKVLQEGEIVTHQRLCWKLRGVQQ